MSYFITLRCPCSAVTIPYGTFVSLSPTLHQVCSSDFVSDRWLSILANASTATIRIDWRDRASSQFQLLSQLCQLASETIDDAVSRFLLEPFVTLSLPSESDFNKQMNTTLTQFLRSTIIYFDLLLNTERLLIQIDQPFLGSKGENYIFYQSTTPDIVTNDPPSLQVCVLTSFDY